MTNMNGGLAPNAQPTLAANLQVAADRGLSLEFRQRHDGGWRVILTDARAGTMFDCSGATVAEALAEALDQQRESAAFGAGYRAAMAGATLPTGKGPTFLQGYFAALEDEAEDVVYHQRQHAAAGADQDARLPAA